MRSRVPVGSGAVAILAAALACASSEAQRDQTGKSAVQGAMIGAIGGLIVAGMADISVATPVGIGVGVGAAVGAAVGASTDPYSGPTGPTRAADPPAVLREQQRKLREQLGPSAYAGLEALAACRHDEALTWAKNAAYTDNPDHALAGVWLTAVTYGDAGRIEEASAVLPELVARDPRVPSEDVAKRLVDQRVVQIQDIRVSYGHPATCA